MYSLISLIVEPVCSFISSFILALSSFNFKKGSEIITPNSIPQLVLHLANYQYKSAFVADHEINLVACMTEIMSEVKFQ